MVGEGRRDPRLPISSSASRSAAARRPRSSERSPAPRRAAAPRRAWPPPATVWIPNPPCPAHQKKPGDRIEPEHRQAVGREAPEARPAAFDRLDRPVDDRLEAVDGGRNVELLGRCVAGVAGGLVVRADPDAIVRFALEVESLERVVDQRQVAQARPADSQLRDRPPVRADTERPTPQRRATSSAQAPAALTMTCGGQMLRTRFHDPSFARAARRVERRRAQDLSAAAPEMSEASLVQSGDVDVGAARVVELRNPSLRAEPGIGLFKLGSLEPKAALRASSPPAPRAGPCSAGDRDRPSPAKP